MPRVYKTNPGAKTYRRYDKEVIKKALEELANTDNSIVNVAKRFGISKSVLGRHKLKDMKPSGGQTALSAEAENCIVQNLNICAEWGYPLTTMDLRYVVKMYLDALGIKHKRFKDNLPGQDFVYGFLNRQKDKISKRISQNIKRVRAAVSTKTIKDYFTELQKSIENVPLSNIVNYDETNLTDDPGRKQVLVKRGCKYPERVMNQTKGSISLMIAATADGELLPPYVVYKATHLYNTWVKNGPKNCRYNRSGSGWFDGEIFADWIKTMVIPILSNKPGKKILIGDNLSSHLSVDIIKLCYEKDIHFMFLPSNSTHLTQPLDVAFFRPMKVAWRLLLENWKRTDGRTLSTIPKGCFPRLLKLLMDKVKINCESNIKAGFRKTGIAPLDVNEILKRLPKEEQDCEVDKETVDESFVKYLKELRYGTMEIKEPKYKKKLEVVAGRSVSETEAEKTETGPANKKQKLKKPKQENPLATEKKGKGKGTGKKTKQNWLSKENETEKENENHAKQDKQNEKTSGNISYSDIKGQQELDVAAIDISKMPVFFAENLDVPAVDIDAASTSKMPIYFTDDIDCINEVIVESENKKKNECKQEKKEDKPSKIKIISDIRLPVPLKKVNKNYYLKTDEILKILEG